MMKKLAIVLIFLTSFSTLATGAVEQREDFHVSLFALGAANKAKQMCSCLFVMHRDRKFCDRFSVPDKYLDWVDSVNVDSENKIVKAAVAIFWKGQAKYISEKRGCQLQPR